jgi:hypothetical protein
MDAEAGKVSIDIDSNAQQVLVPDVTERGERREGHGDR